MPYADPEKRREYQRRWQAAWRIKNLDKARERSRRSYAKSDGWYARMRADPERWASRKRQLSVYSATPERRAREAITRTKPEQVARRRAYAKLYRQKHKERLYALTYAWKARQQQIDPGYAIEMRLRARIIAATKAQNGRKHASTAILIGCSIIELRAYIEARFLPGMTWENRREWHIDHIKPCASFDLTDLQQQKACFHFSNLRPLWALDNIRKGKRHVI